MVRDQVFISYSHADSEWLNRLQTMLIPLQRQGTLDAWADTQSQQGQLWKEEIQRALARAKVAVLLVSPDFLASEFIHQNELPPLLEASRQEGVTILWVPVRHSLYKATTIARFQAACDPKTPLSMLPLAQQEAELVRLAEKLMAIRPLPASPPSLPPESALKPPLAEPVVKSPSSSSSVLPQRGWGQLLIALVLGVLGGAFVYHLGKEWFEKASLPPVQNMQGWLAPQVQALQQQTAQALKTKVEFRDNLKEGGQGSVMVVIPAGRFQIGSPDTEPERGKDERQHEVEVQAFAMGEYEVTVRQFKRFVETTQYKTDAEKSGGCYYLTKSGWEYDADKNWRNPGFSQTDNDPVVCISWKDATEYVNWLREQTGKQYHLPTEAEWEYAARAGTTTPFYFGDTISTDQANYDGNYTYGNGHTGIYRQKALEVGQFPANAWGLYDMHGNAGEWTCSVYDKEYSGGEQHCDEPGTSSLCVLRGGSWLSEPGWLRGAARSRDFPHAGLNFWGFRLARTLSL